MSTQSLIAKQNVTDGSYRAVKVARDGYPHSDSQGGLLAAHYATDDEVQSILDFGWTQQLGSDDEWATPNPQAVDLADRDALEAFATSQWVEYVYIWQDGAWYAAQVEWDSSSLNVADWYSYLGPIRPLAELTAEKDAEQAARNRR